MRYFAYGSNMLTFRLEQRVGAVGLLGPARIRGRRLAFHTRCGDGSGKCDIPVADRPDRVVHGVVYEVAEEAVPLLDRYEGGYERSVIEVEMRGELIPVHAYFGKSGLIDGKCLPYDWYVDLVVAGAKQHGLHHHYRDLLAEVKVRQDPLPHRRDRLEALRLLDGFYGAAVEPSDPAT